MVILKLVIMATLKKKSFILCRKKKYTEDVNGVAVYPEDIENKIK